MCMGIISTRTGLGATVYQKVRGRFWVSQSSSLQNCRDGRFGLLECLSGEQFVKDVFVDSDTDIMVLTFVPSTPDTEPLKIEEAEVTKQLLNKDGTENRLLVHGRVNPNQDGDLE